VGRWSDKLKAAGVLELDVPSIKTPPKEPEDRVIAFGASRDGERVAIGGSRRGIVVAPAKAGADLRGVALTGHLVDLAFNPAGASVAVIEAGEATLGESERIPMNDAPPPVSRTRPKRVALLSGDDLAPVWSTPVDGNAQRIAFSPDGSTIYTTDATSTRVTLRLWRASDGALIDAVAHRVEHRTDPAHGQIDISEATVRDMAVSASIVAAVTSQGVWYFRPASL
jgi:hypothetical protein